MHITWYTAMAMDGRIADGQDSLAFLDTIGTFDGSDTEFATFITTIDAIIIGASTLRWLLREGHGWPHGDIPTWLVSHDDQLLAQVGTTQAPFTRVAGDLAGLATDLAALGYRRVWLCGGGNVAGQMLALDAIDEVIVTVAPVALGQGPALFDGAGLPQRRFRLVECRALSDRAARLHWQRERQG